MSNKWSIPEETAHFFGKYNFFGGVGVEWDLDCRCHIFLHINLLRLRNGLRGGSSRSSWRRDVSGEKSRFHWGCRWFFCLRAFLLHLSFAAALWRLLWQTLAWGRAELFQILLRGSSRWPVRVNSFSVFIHDVVIFFLQTCALRASISSWCCLPTSCWPCCGWIPPLATQRHDCSETPIQDEKYYKLLTRFSNTTQDEIITAQKSVTLPFLSQSP